MFIISNYIFIIYSGIVILIITMIYALFTGLGKKWSVDIGGFINLKLFTLLYRWKSKRFEKPLYLSMLAKETRNINVGFGGYELDNLAAKHISLSLNKAGSRNLAPDFPALTDGGNTVIKFEQLLTTNQTLTILGDPGAGKTSLLRFSVMIRTRDNPPLPNLPIFIKLREYDEINFEDALEKQAEKRGFRVDFFNQFLQSGKCLVMFDGLDELSEEKRAKWVIGIKDFAGAWCTDKNNRVVVTSRKEGFTGVTDFKDYDICPLNDSQIKSFIGRIIQDEKKQVKLLKAINKNEWLQEWAKLPLTLTIISILYKNGKNLESASRVGLYEEYLKYMIEGREKKKFLVRLRMFRSKFDSDKKIKVLQDIAYKNILSNKRAFKREDLLDQLSSAMNENKLQGSPKQLLNELIETNGIFIRLGDNIEYFHSSYQEFLVARKLSAASNREQAVQLFVKKFDSSLWREVILYWVSLVDDVSALLYELNNRAHYKLAFNCIKYARKKTLNSRMIQTTIYNAILDGILPNSLELSELEKVCRELDEPTNLLILIKIYESLKKDEFFRNDKIRQSINLIEQNLVVKVQAGDFYYQDEKISLDYDYGISLFPVTNSEFKAFVNTDGYLNQDYWSEEGWIWLREEKINSPAFFDDNKFNLSNQPVVGVSWYEAEAYANWKSKLTKQCYRLPKENEWEKAASGGIKLPNGGNNPLPEREYPWGNKFDKDKCNTEGSVNDATTPVNKYQNGRSPFGCYDMAGNVCQWCYDWYDKEEKTKVLRGGSWVNDADDARVAIRGRGDPDDRDGDIGFRLAKTL